MRAPKACAKAPVLSIVAHCGFAASSFNTCYDHFKLGKLTGGEIRMLSNLANNEFKLFNS